MTLLLKMFDELAEEEDDVLVKSLYRDYWILPQASMLFPYWKRSFLPISIGLFIFHSSMLTFHFGLLVYSNILLIHERNWALLSLLGHYAILMFFCMFFIVVFNFLRKHVAKQHRLLYSDIGIYAGGRIYTEQWCVDAFKQLKKETLYFLTIPIFVGSVGGVILVVPYLAKWLTGMENPYTPTGINMNLPIAGWYPFPTHEGILHFIAVSGQGLGIASLSIIFFTSLLMMIDVIQRFRGEFRVIMYSLDTLFTRSLSLYHLKHPERKGMELDYKDYDYQRVIEMCLRDTLIHHQKLSEMISTFHTEASLPSGLAYMTGLLVIGICLYNILIAMAEQNYGSIVTFVALIIAEVLTMFLLSLLGASLTEESENLRNELYFMEWYNLDLRNRKTILNFQTAITEPVVIKAVGLVDLNMDTFSSIMNSAYSFFNIMNVQ